MDIAYQHKKKGKSMLPFFDCDKLPFGIKPYEIDYLGDLFGTMILKERVPTLVLQCVHADAIRFGGQSSVGSAFAVVCGESTFTISAFVFAVTIGHLSPPSPYIIPFLSYAHIHIDIICDKYAIMIERSIHY